MKLIFLIIVSCSLFFLFIPHDLKHSGDFFFFYFPFSISLIETGSYPEILAEENHGNLFLVGKEKERESGAHLPPLVSCDYFFFLCSS